MQLPTDLYEQIFINLDIDTIINFTHINKNVNIDNFEFWKAKFYNDGIPLLATVLPYTQKGWIKEYIKVERTMDMADYILKKLKALDINIAYLIYDPKLHKKNYDYIYQFLDNTLPYDKDTKIYYPIHLYDDRTENTLLYIIYHIPNIIICNVKSFLPNRDNKPSNVPILLIATFDTRYGTVVL